MTTSFASILRQRGVTMVEMIVVIVITGIIGGVVALFIRLPVQNYTESVARAAATDLADSSLRRIARDLRLALPNSVRVPAVPLANTRYIEYLHTTAGLRYLAEDDVVGTAAPGNYLNWNDATKTSFDVVGGVPTGRHAPAVKHFIVVYNLGEGQEPGNAYDCISTCNRAQISGISATTITLASNPFPAQAAAGTALMSPTRRAHVVTSAVTYGCNLAAGTLTRYWGYTIAPTQPTPPTTGNSALVAENIKACDFRYTNLVNQRSALIGLSLTLGIPGQPNAKIELEHQVHVDNTP